VVDRRRRAGDGRRELLDVAIEPKHQPRRGRLAAGRVDCRAFDLLRACKVAAYLYTPLALRGAAVGLLSLLRNEGGSVGTSVAQTVQERRDQFHALRLGEYLDQFNPAVHSFIGQARGLFQTGDPVLSKELAWQVLDNLRQQQASALAYFDCFWLMAVVMLALLPVVLLMKRSVAQKGARIGGE
jgi:MFS transporter, DHA2 family, multidrug resistance protein